MYVSFIAELLFAFKLARIAAISLIPAVAIRDGVSPERKIIMCVGAVFELAALNYDCN